MRKFLPILCFGVALTAAAKNEVYETPNTGTQYTFADLAKIEASGVTKIGTQCYKVEKDLEIVEKDGLKIENHDTIMLAKDVQIRLYGGQNDFAPADTALFCPSEPGIKPKSIHFTGMIRQEEIRHIRFETIGIRSGGPYGITVENCTFYEHLPNGSNYTIGFVGKSVGNILRNNHFIRTNLSAIGAGSNVAAGVIIEDNIFEDCSTANRNYPVINEVPSGDNGMVIIRRNKIFGGKRLMPGAISVSNMLTMTGTNKIVIEDNYMDNSRYGINVLGNLMDIRITGNKIIDCHYENKAANGGSGITLNSSAKDPKNATKVYVEGNHIEGCLWGITVIGKTIANLGRLDNPNDSTYNPGRNVFKNNGNCGTAPEGETTAFDPSIPYDLYNNTTETLYAQGNIWGGTDQSAAEIEKRIFHKTDDPNLGEVIFLPAGSSSGITSVEGEKFTIVNHGGGMISINGCNGNEVVNVYDLSGKLLFSGSVSEPVAIPQRGIVIVTVNNSSFKLSI